MMKTQMSEEARAKKNAYQRAYRNANKTKTDEYLREWRKRNPDKVRQYQVNYWERKAAEAEPASMEARARHLHEQGYSLREIGSRLNVSHMTVKRLLRDCNTL